MRQKSRRPSSPHSTGAASPARTRKIKRYGWIPDIPDQRDFLYAAPPTFLRALPNKVDLRPKCPPVYDQGDLGSCTANAISGAIEFDQMKEGLPQIFIPSRLFIYYNERVIEGTINSDSGAMLRDGIKTVAKQGACPEPMWPYQIAKFKTKPSATCYKEAAKHTAVSYQRLVQSLSQMQAASLRDIHSSLASPFTKALRPTPSPGLVTRRCPRRANTSSAVMPSALLAMIRPDAGSSVAIAGEQAGACAAISPFPSPI
jgi:hypothetical protein